MLWDGGSGQLWVYGSRKWEDIEPDHVSLEISRIMHSREFKVDRIIGNEDLFGDVIEKTPARLINDSMRKNNTNLTLIKPLFYDPFGSITYVNALFSSKHTCS